jgi:hypothetical protein
VECHTFRKLLPDNTKLFSGNAKPKKVETIAANGPNSAAMAEVFGRMRREGCWIDNWGVESGNK